MTINMDSQTKIEEIQENGILSPFFVILRYY